MSRTQRLSYVDGLRGLAVAMVMLSHSVWKDLNGLIPITQLSGPRMGFDFIAHEGFHGVSLFLVISGFCLAYPALARRQSQEKDWFSVSQFLARRCLRILPPYYAALAIFVLATLALDRMHAPTPPSLNAAPISVPNVAAHVLLIHNLTPWYGAINGAFWSLGLEWQWYFVFPLLLALAVRSRVLAVAACAVAAMTWHIGTHDAWQVWNATESAALPERLFEFCCGILAAQIVLCGSLQSRRSRMFLVALILTPLVGAFLSVYTTVNHLLFGQPQPFYGMAFGALLVLGSQPGRLNAILSSRPLCGLGIISYSVYLVHQPIIEAVEMSAPGPLQAWYLAPIPALLVAILAGYGFHVLIERPCMDKALWRRVSAPLMRCFACAKPADALFGAPRDDGVGAPVHLPTAVEARGT